MTDPRTSRNESSVRQLHAYLISVLQEPTKFIDDEPLKMALASQSGLAHFEQPDLGITAMSLNTAKRAAAVIFEEDGYSKLDRLRLECSDAIASARKAVTASSARETKTYLRARAEAAERQVLILSEDLQIATGLLKESMLQARAYAKRADAATQSRCEKEQRDLLRMLGIMRKALM